MSDENPHSTNGSPKKTWLNKLGQLLQGEPQNRDELVELIQDANERELIDGDTRNMIEGVLEVSEMRVRDIMIPRSQMVTIDISQPFEEVFPLVVESAHSRFPVINDDKDHIEGTLHAKDLLAYSYLKSEEPFNFEKILRPAVIVPESKRVDVLLKEFRSNRYHMAIVVDEYGGVSGLVTIEDILELIVGEIEDEFDEQNDKELIRKIGKRIFSVQGLTEIDEFNEHFGSEFSDDEFDTVGGLVMHAFGHMPVRDEKIEINGMVFKVMQADRRRIKQLQVKIPRNQKLPAEH